MAAPNDLKRTSRIRDGSLSPPPVKRKIESTTTKKALASFFTPTSQKEPENINWRTVNSTLLVGKYSPQTDDKSIEPPTKRRKIAAFDLDSTLIQTISGNVFSKSSTDWRWWYPSVPSVLKKLYADGYVLVILTNQGSVSLTKNPNIVQSEKRPGSLSSFKSKVTTVFSQLDLPVTLFAATGRDQYRKPRAGMWNEVLEEFDLDVDGGPDLEASFFVGDAGGRPARSTIKADFSCSDRNLAANVGITFQTPEEYFLDEAPHPYVRDFDPKSYLNPTSSTSTDTIPVVFEKRNSSDIVLFCGSPGSGKSTFYWQSLKRLGYERVNQDLLKSREKCLKVASTLLSEGKSVAVDNTNADADTRAVWIALAHKSNVPIRCVHFTTPAKLCEHNDTVRALSHSSFNPEKRSILPHAAFAGFTSRFKEPRLNEGFQDIIQIEFQLTAKIAQFQFKGDEQQRKLWSKHWI